MNIKELLQLTGDQGKVIILGEDGEVKGVFLSWDQYQTLSGVTNNFANQSASAKNMVEEVNREITKAQLEDPITPNTVVAEAPVMDLPVSAPTHIQAAISERAQELFKSMPFGRMPQPTIDLREQVIDPNFQWNTPASSDEDEEIKPQFEDV